MNKWKEGGTAVETSWVFTEFIHSLCVGRSKVLVVTVNALQHRTLDGGPLMFDTCPGRRVCISYMFDTCPATAT